MTSGQNLTPPAPFPQREGGAGKAVSGLKPLSRSGPREASLTGPGSKEGRGSVRKSQEKTHTITVEDDV